MAMYFLNLNHNEIVGYEMDQKLMNNFIFVFLRDLETNMTACKNGLSFQKNA